MVKDGFCTSKCGTNKKKVFTKFKTIILIIPHGYPT
jgi:hypothetical protein